MSTLSNKQKAEINKKNKKNTEKQTANATTEDSIQKQKAKKEAKNARKKDNRKARYEKYKKERDAEMKAELIAYEERRRREYEEEAIKKAFEKAFQTEIWNENKSQIDSFPNKGVVVIIEFCRAKNSHDCKEYYFVFEVEDENENGFMLDLSVYKNYIFRKILSTSLEFKFEELEHIFKSAHIKFSNVQYILDNEFKNFNVSKVIRPFSLKDSIYKKLISEFTSKYYKGVILAQTQLLICKIKDCFKLMRINITDVTDNTSGIERNIRYYSDIADKFLNSEDSYLDDYDYSDEDTKTYFKISIQYHRGCSQCDIKNIYTLTFDIGYEYKSETYSIVYRDIHYTIFDIDALFAKLLNDKLIYDNPICQMCCKKNEIEEELNNLASKLYNSGLDFIGKSYEKYARKPCLVITLSKNKNNDVEYVCKNAVKLFKYNENYNSSKNAHTNKATVPLIREFQYWSPYADVTNSFRRMQIAFIIVCQKYLPVKLPDDICTHIFTFIIIPNMKSGVCGYKEVKLDFTKPEQISSFVRNVNFLTFQ